MNQRPWEFLVRNKAIFIELSEMKPSSKVLAKAPPAVVIVVRPERMMVKDV